MGLHKGSSDWHNCPALVKRENLFLRLDTDSVNVGSVTATEDRSECLVGMLGADLLMLQSKAQGKDPTP